MINQQCYHAAASWTLNQRSGMAPILPPSSIAHGQPAFRHGTNASPSSITHVQPAFRHGKNASPSSIAHVQPAFRHGTGASTQQHHVRATSIQAWHECFCPAALRTFNQRSGVAQMHYPAASRTLNQRSGMALALPPSSITHVQPAFRHGTSSSPSSISHAQPAFRHGISASTQQHRAHSACIHAHSSHAYNYKILALTFGRFERRMRLRWPLDKKLGLPANSETSALRGVWRYDGEYMEEIKARC